MLRNAETAGTIPDVLDAHFGASRIMGGKRPEQIHKDLIATDFKTRPEDEHIYEEDKQKLHTERGKLAIPKNSENPALTELKRKREEGDEKEGEKEDEE
jgi:hypothetical protein